MLSTSESINEYKSIAESIPRKIMIVISVESKNVFIVLVVPNYPFNGAVKVKFVSNVSVSTKTPPAVEMSPVI